MSDFDLLPDQPSTADQIRRIGPPALVALAALLFILQNTESARFEFLWFDFEWPLWIMLLVFMGAGGGGGLRHRSTHPVAARPRSRRRLTDGTSSLSAT